MAKRTKAGVSLALVSISGIEIRIVDSVRHLCQACSIFAPKFDLVGLSRNDVLEVVLQGLHIGAGVFGRDTLVDFDDNIGEAVWVQVDFLVIRDLTDCAVGM